MGLTLDAAWLRIESGPRLRLVPRAARLRIDGVPTQDVWINSNLVTSVRPVGRWFSPGLMFDSAEGIYDGVIVWLFRSRRDETLRLLASCGWPVAAAPNRP